MAIQEINQRQHLIIRRLKRNPCTFEELQDYLKQESEIRGDDLTMSIRTFKRDRENIFITYGIDIEYDSSIKAYKINKDFPLEVEERIMEAYDLIDTFKLNQDIKNFVHFDQRKAHGTDNMYGILHAIKNKLVIHFEYHKYADINATFRKAHPYLLKEFKSRWYLLAKDLKDNRIKTFALDRIISIELKKEKFNIPADFDAHAFFKHSFGIERNEDDVLNEVVLSFSAFQGKYLKSMPLHHSQEVLIDNEQEFRIKLNIYLTHDFLLELLSFGANVRVISPNILIEQLKEHYTKALNQYK